jgi:hypothetical protein
VLPPGANPITVGKYINKCVSVSCQIAVKREFSRQIFEKYSNTEFYENPSLGAQLLRADGQTDRHDEANSRLSQFCYRAKNPNPPPMHTAQNICILFNKTVADALSFSLICLFTKHSAIVTD